MCAQNELGVLRYSTELIHSTSSLQAVLYDISVCVGGGGGGYKIKIN